MLYFMLSKSNKSENTIVESSNSKKFDFYIRVSTRAGICSRLVVITSTGTSLWLGIGTGTDIPVLQTFLPVQVVYQLNFS